MTDEKVLEVVKKSRQIIQERWPNAAPKRHETLTVLGLQTIYDSRIGDHLLHCCDQIPEILKQDKEKAMRWLGFVQGALWGLFGMSVEELANMNRKED